jgi:hypothetical protein
LLGDIDMSKVELVQEFVDRIQDVPGGSRAVVFKEAYAWLVDGCHSLGVVPLQKGKYIIGIRSGNLPSMCGGSSLYIAEASTANEQDICSLTIDPEESGYFVGSYYGTDVYDKEGYSVWGVQGQVIVQFSKDMSVEARAASLDYLRAQFVLLLNRYDDICLDVCSVPEYTTVKWLAKDTVGLFTAYTDEPTNCGYYKTYDPEKELDRVRVRGYTGTPSLRGTSGSTLAGHSCCVCTNYYSDFNRGLSPRAVLRESAVIYDMLDAAGIKGDTVILTDNMGGGRYSTNTIDVIHWLAEYGPDVQAQVDDWLPVNGVYIKCKGFVTTLFPVAHNPNEGAHEITGCSLCSIENAPADDAPYEMEVWTYE